MKFLFKHIIRILIYFIVGVVLLSLGYPLLEGERLSLPTIIVISLIWSFTVPFILHFISKNEKKHYPIIKARGSEDDSSVDLILSDEKFDIICKHTKLGIYEIEYQVGNTFTSLIEMRGVERIFQISNTNMDISKSFSGEKYEICGRVIDTKNPTVSCGKYKFMIDKPLPEGTNEGDFVSMTAHSFHC